MNTTSTSYTTFFWAAIACTIYRTRCGFVLESDGGGDGESCKWREMEKVGFTEVREKMCTGTKWPFRVLLDIAPLVFSLNSFANMAETPPVVEL
uniref:Uncharacterized protein n=1 Tax=Tanacetum cinerariifolium TaxID=118510 RepID=A0A6L2JIW1_TANCI|nr:hypothetical protein [Tanacetum cinerariifolium]